MRLPLILILEEETHPNKDLKQQLTQQNFEVMRSGRSTEGCKISGRSQKTRYSQALKVI